ncbi:MAG: hypothetical protein HY651_07690 [Acidobacteria bacterium]|nr:hypothetical protein [Acidobacteriota bacterium]
MKDRRGVASPGANLALGTAQTATARSALTGNPAKFKILAFLSQLPQELAVVRDFKLSTLITLESGRPFSVHTGADSNSDGDPFSDRPGLLLPESG